MKRVLVIGNSKSVWIKEYVKHIHCDIGNRVCVTDYYGLDDEEKKFYSKLGVEILNINSNNKFIKLFKYFFAFIKYAIRNQNRLDIIDIQSPPATIQAMAIKKLIDISGAKVVTTFWGSDILQADYRASHKMKTILDKSTWINIGTLDMQSKLCLFYGDIYNDRCSFVGFGSPAIEEIKLCKLSKLECKKMYGMSSNKTAVAIGYNGRREQQHIEVINSLSNLDDIDKNKIELLLHIGYNTPEGYLNELLEALKKSKISYVIIDRMLNLSEIACLRKATDVFIHAQMSDGLSGSIRECVYAEAILINPIWIKYDKFDSDGVDYIKYSSFNELSNILKNVISGDTTINLKNNKEILYKEYSWNSVRYKWVKMFNE